MFLLLLGTCCVVFVSGCSKRLGDFTLLTTKNIDLSSFSTCTDDGKERVNGEDASHIIVVFPTKVPNFKDAVDNAIEASNSYMLSDAVVRYTWFYIPLIYGQEKFIVEGHPVRNN